MWNGIVTASVVINDQGEVLTVPKLTQSGISDTNKMKNILMEISLLIEDLIDNINDPVLLTDNHLESEIKKIIVSQMKKSFSVRPLTNIHINRLL